MCGCITPVDPWVEGNDNQACLADVWFTMSKACNGRNICEIDKSEDAWDSFFGRPCEFAETQPDIELHLNVTYHCLPNYISSADDSIDLRKKMKQPQEPFSNSNHCCTSTHFSSYILIGIQSQGPIHCIQVLCYYLQPAPQS